MDTRTLPKTFLALHGLPTQRVDLLVEMKDVIDLFLLFIVPSVKCKNRMKQLVKVIYIILNKKQIFKLRRKKSNEKDNYKINVFVDGAAVVGDGLESKFVPSELNTEALGDRYTEDGARSGGDGD